MDALGGAKVEEKRSARERTLAIAQVVLGLILLNLVLAFWVYLWLRPLP